MGCERVGSCEPGLVAFCALCCGVGVVRRRGCVAVWGCSVCGCGPCVVCCVALTVCGLLCACGAVCADALCACGAVCVSAGVGGHERRGPAVRAPLLLWVCVGGGVLLSHTLAGAVPSALAVLASGFGKGKSGRVPAAMAAAALAGPDPAPPGGGCGIRVSHSGHGSSCSPSPGACRPHKRKERGVCWVGRPISAGRLHSLAGRPPPVYQPRRLRGAFPHA